MTDNEIRALSNESLLRAVAEMRRWTNLKMEHVRGVGCPGRDMLVGIRPDGAGSEVVPDYLWDGNAWLNLLCDVRSDLTPPRLLIVVSAESDSYIVTLSTSGGSVTGQGSTMGEAICRVCLMVRSVHGR